MRLISISTRDGSSRWNLAYRARMACGDADGCCQYRATAGHILPTSSRVSDLGDSYAPCERHSRRTMSYSHPSWGVLAQRNLVAIRRNTQRYSVLIHGARYHQRATRRISQSCLQTSSPSPKGMQIEASQGITAVDQEAAESELLGTRRPVNAMRVTPLIVRNLHVPRTSVLPGAICWKVPSVRITSVSEAYV